MDFHLFQPNRKQQLSKYQVLGLVASSPLRGIVVALHIGSTSAASGANFEDLFALQPRGTYHPLIQLGTKPVWFVLLLQEWSPFSHRPGESVIHKRPRVRLNPSGPALIPPTPEHPPRPWGDFAEINQQPGQHGGKGLSVILHRFRIGKKAQVYRA